MMLCASDVYWPGDEKNPSDPIREGMLCAVILQTLVCILLTKASENFTCFTILAIYLHQNSSVGNGVFTFGCVCYDVSEWCLLAWWSERRQTGELWWVHVLMHAVHVHACVHILLSRTLEKFHLYYYYSHWYALKFSFGGTTGFTFDTGALIKNVTRHYGSCTNINAKTVCAQMHACCWKKFVFLCFLEK